MVEVNKWTQDLDPKSSPHLEEELIGGVVDLDLLFQSPKKDARIIGVIERNQGFSRSAMECIFMLKNSGNIGEEDPFL